MDATVVLLRLRSSLVNLPPEITSSLLNSNFAVQNVVVEIVGRGYAGWSGFTSTSRTVELDESFAASLSTHEGDKVTLKMHVNPPEATVVHLEPVSVDDWESVELHAQYLESNMIAQVRAVSSSQPVIVHLQNTVASLLVTRFTTASSPTPKFAKLAPNAEIIVAPKTRKAKSATDRSKPSKKSVTDQSRNSVIMRAVTLPNASIPLDLTDAADTIAIYVDRESVFPVLRSAKLAQVSISLPPLLRSENDELVKIVANVVHAGLPANIVAVSSQLAKALGMNSLASLRIEPAPTSTVSAPKPADSSSESLSNHALFGVDREITRIVKSLTRGAGVLLTGGKGAGKSALSSHVQNLLTQSLIYSFTVDCTDFADERLSVIRQQFQLWAAEARWHHPSVIVLRNLDLLVPEEQQHIDSTRTNQITQLLLYYVKHPILATATSAVNQTLITSHLLTHLSLKPPDKHVRTDILNSLQSTESSLDLAEIAELTEGYLPGDLVTLTNRARHEALIARAIGDVDAQVNGQCAQSSNGTSNHVNGYENKSNGDVSHVAPVHTRAPTLDDYNRALKDFIPNTLRGVNVQKSTVEWKDIGGLHATKRVLKETLEWPTKYAPIFESCPLRLRSGLLLYGYPGCGKTFLASAVAHECGLNFITIKGPELLNKYIGASEKSVRDIFDRAQAAKPCVLFFDEFDSIAPKRGHDSTGVTDRVVNQMLTQMDGAEGLDGVYVLAATSRPDLIDSALLRPGRIDKSLLCDMPSYDDRLEILTALKRKMKTSDDVDLSEIALATGGFSGADLQALMYNAHLNAVHTVIDGGHTEVRNVTVESFTIDLVGTQSESLTPITTHHTPQLQQEVVIGREDISSSLESTKPSISRKEYERLRAVYDEFVNGRSGDMPTGIASNEIGGRATLM